MLFHIIHILDKFESLHGIFQIFFLAQLYMSADMRETPTQTYVLPILKGVINGMAVTLEISFEVFQKPDRNFL
jgi:hypothetical protein